jgi:hypothetical protein
MLSSTFRGLFKTVLCELLLSMLFMSFQYISSKFQKHTNITSHQALRQLMSCCCVLHRASCVTFCHQQIFKNRAIQQNFPPDRTQAILGLNIRWVYISEGTSNLVQYFIVCGGVNMSSDQCV